MGRGPQKQQQQQQHVIPNQGICRRLMLHESSLTFLLLHDDSSSKLIWLHAGTRSICPVSSMIPSIISIQKWVPSAYHIFTKSRMWVFQEQTWVGGGLGAGHSTQEGAHEDLGACLFSSFPGHQDKSFPQMNCSQDLILRYLSSKSF